MGESSQSAGRGHQDGASALETSLALDGDGSPIARARHLAAAFLAKARDDHGIAVVTSTVEVVQLIVSELVTNACKYAPGPALLHLRIIGAVLRVQLWDSSPVLPMVRAPDPERIGRHGLEIVTALAHSITMEQTPVGKRVVVDVVLDTSAA
ncbi:ATP-binding protein [Streptomyces sp. NPDC002516]